MSMMNRSEAEIDAIRLELYEETKDLTREEIQRRYEELEKQLSAEFGFTIATPEEMKRREAATRSGAD